LAAFACAMLSILFVFQRASPDWRVFFYRLHRGNQRLFIDTDDKETIEIALLHPAVLEADLTVLGEAQPHDRRALDLRRSSQLERDEIRLNRKDNGSALPLPLWERVGVRGYSLSLGRNPSPGSHLAMRSDLSHKGRGEVSRRQNRFNQKPSGSRANLNSKAPVWADVVAFRRLPAIGRFA
jgi:hypothetical protein